MAVAENHWFLKLVLESMTTPIRIQKSSRLDFSAVCLHFTAILVRFAEKTSGIKTKCPQT